MQLWYSEIENQEISYGYKVENVLFRGHSEFQKVDVIETSAYGRMLVIDDLVMLSQSDEFVYHEMIAHVPMLLHKMPHRVLVIGGGDGGTVRELLKHDDVKEIVLCEIDGMVVDISREFFPEVAAGLGDSRVAINIGDGIEYVKNQASGSFDVVIVDSSDPVGPGEGLFTKEFYGNVAKMVGPDGLLVCQSESPWFDHSFLRRIYDNVNGGFRHATPYIGAIPTYPRGVWSWTVGSQRPLDFQELDERRLESLVGLSYLNSDVFRAAFALPNFYRQKLGI